MGVREASEQISADPARSRQADASAPAGPEGVLLQAWIDRVARMVPGVSRALVVLGDDAEPAALWPVGGPTPAWLLAGARLAQARGAPVQSPAAEGDEAALLAQPLRSGGTVVGALAIALPAEATRRGAVLQLLAWSESFLELLLEYGAAVPAPVGVDVLDDLPLTDDAGALAMALATGLAGRLPARRVWLGLGSEEGVTIRGVSHQSRLETRVGLVGMVEEAMLEAIVVGEAVNTTAERGAAGDAEASPAQAAVLRESRASAVLAVPLLHDGITVGALLAERDGRAFDRGTVDRTQREADAMARLFALHRTLAPGPLGRFEVRLRAFFGRRAATAVHRRRLAVAGALLAVAALVLLRGTHEVRADALVEGRSQQTIAAPFDGFVASAPVRAGQTVRAGELIALLDDRDLRLELGRVEGELDALEREYRQALAALDQAQARILSARRAQARARRELLANRLEQVELRAPMDGLVISGDLSRAVGAPVAKGDALFEMAPDDAWRIVVRVPERDIDEISVGQQGELLLSAYPDRRLPIIVERISSVFDDEADIGVLFRVEAALEESDLPFRPGMEGVARIAVGERSLGWIYTHEIADALRLASWRWLP